MDFQVRRSLTLHTRRRTWKSIVLVFWRRAWKSIVLLATDLEVYRTLATGLEVHRTGAERGQCNRLSRANGAEVRREISCLNK